MVVVKKIFFNVSNAKIHTDDQFFMLNIFFLSSRLIQP